MKFDRNSFERSVSDYELNWKVVDDVLYKLCRPYPGHHDSAGVSAKVLLIGRTYATGIERKIESTGTQGSSITQLAEFLHEHHARVDSILATLHSVAEPLDPEKLKAIVDAHDRFAEGVSATRANAAIVRGQIPAFSLLCAAHHGFSSDCRNPQAGSVD